MAVAAAKIKSASAAQSPFLSTAMFAPAALYILLLVAGPFLLAVFYAFSDARIGNTELHYVGLENFRSILQSPSFRIAIPAGLAVAPALPDVFPPVKLRRGFIGLVRRHPTVAAGGGSL